MPPSPFRACVFGASGGIGAALVAALATRADAHEIYAGSRGGGTVAGATPFAFDLTDEASIAAAAAKIGAGGALDLVIVATGLLHDGAAHAPEKSSAMQSAEAYARAFAINATGPALIGKHVLPLLARDRRSVFAALSARVGSISDNRLGGWHAYRASKAALNMIVANFAIELRARKSQAIAVTLHPGTVLTALSKPFARGVAEGRLFTPEFAAARLLETIAGLGVEDSGGLYAWDGERIDP